MLHDYLTELDKKGVVYKVRCMGSNYDRTFDVVNHDEATLMVTFPNNGNKSFIAIDAMHAIEVIEL